jgi:hypothetical protein
MNVAEKQKFFLLLEERFNYICGERGGGRKRTNSHGNTKNTGLLLNTLKLYAKKRNGVLQ